MKSKQQHRVSIFSVSVAMAALTIGAVIAIGSGAFAKEPKFSITVSPPRQQLVDLTPGKIKSSEFLVKNTGDIAFSFKVYAAPYQVDSEYRNVFDRETRFTQISRWITFGGKKEITYRLEAGKEQAIPYDIAVPTNAPGGGQYASLIVETIPDTTKGSGLSEARQIASLLHAQMAGKTTIQGEVIDSQLPFWYGESNNTTELTIKNSGNTDFVASSYVVVRTLGGESVYESKPAQSLLFPETTRKQTLDWYAPSVVGLYTVAIRTTINGSLHEQSKLVLILPVYIIVLLAVLLLSGGYLLYKYLAGRKRSRHIPRAGVRRYGKK